MKSNHKLLALLAIFILLSGCAGPNNMVNTIAANGSPAGFWKGIWHGITTPVMFWVSLFSSNYSFYEVHNNGGWYNFGYLLGLGGFGSGARISYKK